VGVAACGDDALALVLSKVTKRPITFSYFITDLTVLTLSLTYLPWKQIMFSLLSVMLSSFIIGKIEPQSQR
jgi:uncharacterized membrane-anchored protein YitT (DUF2179 family)